MHNFISYSWFSGTKRITQFIFIRYFFINIIEINWIWMLSFLFFRLCSYRDVCFSCAFRRHQHPEIPFCSHKSFALTRKNRDSFSDSWNNWCDVNKHNPWVNFCYDPSLVGEFWKIPISLEFFFCLLSTFYKLELNWLESDLILDYRSSIIVVFQRKVRTNLKITQWLTLSFIRLFFFLNYCYDFWKCSAKANSSNIIIASTNISSSSFISQTIAFILT